MKEGQVFLEAEAIKQWSYTFYLFQDAIQGATGLLVSAKGFDILTKELRIM